MILNNFVSTEYVTEVLESFSIVTKLLQIYLTEYLKGFG